MIKNSYNYFKFPFSALKKWRSGHQYFEIYITWKGTTNFYKTITQKLVNDCIFLKYTFMASNH